MAKIMLVEDDNNLREIYGARLLAEGHEIVTAKDGEEALATAVKEKPDLIISDVMMPRISGFDMLDILRNAPETKFTKVIMMTALSQAEDKARADSLGADRYLVKSQVTLEDVARVVKDVLEGKTESESTPTPAPEAATPATDPVTTTPPTEPAPAAETTPEVPAIPTPPTTPEPVVATPAVSPTPEPSVTPNPVAAEVNTAEPVSVVAEKPEIVPVTDPYNTQPSSSSTTTIPVQTDDPSVTPATDPVTTTPPTEPAPAAETTPEVPAIPTPPTTPEPVVATPAVSPTPEPSVTPNPVAADTNPAEPVSTPQINVELPGAAQPTPEAPEVSNEDTVPEVPVLNQVTDFSENAESNIGPNLMEALEAEADDNTTNQDGNTPKAVEPNNSSPLPGNIQLPEDPAPEAPTEPPKSAPELPQAESVNTPTTPAESPAPEVEAQSDEAPTEETQPASSIGEETHKKMVIQPINDLTKGPDLDALLEEENKMAAVINPAATTIITPDTSPAQPENNPNSPNNPPNQHDIIAL